SRNRFEPDIGEEDDRGGAKNSAPAELTLGAGRRRNERIPIGQVGWQVLENDEAADEDKGGEHRHLDGDDDVVESGAFGDTDDQQGAERDGYQSRRQVERIDHW